MLELLIDKKENVKNIMLVENGILLEKHEEHENQKRLEGNIYIGRVENVLKGMQSAFIDIGEDKNTLIKLKDALPKVDEAKENIITDKDITDVLKPGMEILIQIKKDGTLSKGAKVSTHINLAGRFIALLPETNIIAVSQKITEEEEKERLRKIVKSELPENIGAIIRTTSKNANEDLIKEDIKYLLKKWQEIKDKQSSKNKAPALLYDNNALIRRTIIDIIDRNLQRIIINDKETYEGITKILENVKVDIVLRENENLFNLYGLEEQIKKLANRKIWLKCGGFITIDKTEALTAIDVNTGKFIGKNDIEKTVYEVNKEATVEIAKQLRLRDIGGIIIIDYIDMQIEENKKEIVELLKEQLKKDRTKSQVEGFTKLNLLEMTRKNMCNNDWNNEGEF